MILFPLRLSRFSSFVVGRARESLLVFANVFVVFEIDKTVSSDRDETVNLGLEFVNLVAHSVWFVDKVGYSISI